MYVYLIKPIKKAAYSYHPDLTNTVVFLFCVGSSLYTVQMSLLEKLKEELWDGSHPIMIITEV